MPRTFLLSLFLASMCFRSFAAVDSGLLALAPANSQVMISVDFEGSRNSAFGQFLLHQASAQDRDLQQLLDQTGFDPRHDLQFLLLAVTPSQGSKAQGSFAVLARGNFDQTRIKEAALKDGSVVQSFGGVDLLVKNHHGGQTAFAFPDAGLGVLGDLASVKQVIENRSRSANLDPALQYQISNVETNNVWFASIAPASSLAMGVDPSFQKSPSHAQVLQSITRSSGGIEFGSASDVVYNAETRSAQDAAALADVIRFLASMVQMQRGTDGQATALATALDSMRLDVVGSSVHMTVHLPESALEQLITMQHQKAAPGARQ